jgi:Ca2+-dependent lipid-binding protein
MAAAGHLPPGELEICVLQGRNMPNKDIGKMDPFCKLTVGSRGAKGGESYKTKIIERGGSNVTWEEVFRFKIDGTQDSLTIYAADDDNLSDDKIGDVEVNLFDVVANGANVHWYPLALKGKPAGEISITAKFCAYAVGALRVIVHTGSKLKDQDVLMKMDPYVTIQLDHQDAKRTKTQNGAGASPNFNDESFVFQLKGQEHYLVFKVFDDDLGKDDFVGGHRVDMRKLGLDFNPNHPELNLNLGSGDAFDVPAGVLKVSFQFTPA